MLTHEPAESILIIYFGYVSSTERVLEVKDEALHVGSISDGSPSLTENNAVFIQLNINNCHIKKLMSIRESEVLLDRNGEIPAIKSPNGVHATILCIFPL
jgi:hypothetical protein